MTADEERVTRALGLDQPLHAQRTLWTELIEIAQSDVWPGSTEEHMQLLIERAKDAARYEPPWNRTWRFIELTGIAQSNDYLDAIGDAAVEREAFDVDLDHALMVARDMIQ